MSGILLAEGVVEVTADAKGVPREIAKDIESDPGTTRAAGDKVGRSVFGGIIGAWAAIGGTQIVGDFFKGAVTGASDLSETLSKSEAIFGDMAGTIEEFGNQAYRQVGLSKEAAIGAAAGFGDMFTQLGFASDAAAGMSIKTLQMAADLGSFSNLETGDVVDRISAAFRGEYDSLQAVIPNINAARVESEAMAATGKKTAKELTAQEKATAVLAIVNKDGARAMGDFEKTSGGAANQTKIMTAQFEDQQAKLGGLLLPAWTGFLGFLNGTVMPAFAWFIENIPVLTPIFVGLGAAILTGLAPAIWGAVTATWAWTTALLANPITWLVLGIGTLVAGIVWLATQTTFFSDLWTNVTTWLGEAWQWLWDSVLSPVFTAIGEVFSWIYNTIILPIVTGIMVYIGLWAAVITWLWQSIVSPVLGAIGAAFNWIWQNVISPVVNFISAGIQAWGAVIAWLWGNAISPALNAIGAGFNWVWRTIISPVVNFISGAIRNVGNTVRSVFGGIGSFIGSAFQAALNVVRGPINGIIGLVNSAIRGLNSLSVTIPSWVPIVGGQTWGLSIPTIPMLARGSKNAPDVFIAGENGPELIVGRGGSKVYPADETRNIRGGGGDAPLVAGNLVVNEAEDPLGSAGRVAAELRKFRKRKP